MIDNIATDTALTDLERSQLLVIMGQDGFKVLQKIFRIEVEKFREALLNADPVNKEEVIAAHYLAKSAAMFYTGVVERMNLEVTIQHSNLMLRDNKPEESVTKGLDFGETAELDLESFLGGE